MVSLDAAAGMPVNIPSKPTVKPKAGRDDYLMLLFVCLIGLYLVVSLALPIGLMLWKSMEVRTFDYNAIEMQVDTGNGFQPVDLPAMSTSLGLVDPIAQARRSTSLTAAQLFKGGKFQDQPVSALRVRFTGSPGSGTMEMSGKPVAAGEWVSVAPGDLRRLTLRAGTIRSFENFRTYFGTPALSRSIGNTFMVGLLTTLITVALAFWYAYALHRTCMPFKGIFRMLAMIPILVPSLLGGLSLIYLFGNQGLLKSLMMGTSIYGAQGIVAGSVFFTFPHAFLIISTALTIADARLFEAARALRTSAPRTFFRVTLPGAQYGLISALFVVFTLT
ncbi:MAG: ABC transporter permease subunit, partial [Verrucomicrobiaceae bacterium]